jgi:acetyl-CoA synthase
VFGNIVDKAQVTLITEEAPMEELLAEARAAYKERNDRIANLTDESVDTFYSCLLCQSFAPNHVCVVNPERVGLCGAYNWLDCKASFEINPTGPNQPVPKGVMLDPVKGEFSGPNEFIYQHSNQSVERVTFYSIMEAPMTSCGCFECIMVLVPEANGFMIVSREDPSMTPCGMTFSTLAGTAGGGLQTPGMMGMGKYYLTSKKFIPADGGLKRIVWMSSFLKESMGEALREVCEREGVPDLLERIADETICTDVEGLLPFLEERQHPALTMDELF